MFPPVSVYDGCMTIKLMNGTIVAQSGIVYSTCLQSVVSLLTMLLRYLGS